MKRWAILNAPGFDDQPITEMSNEDITQAIRYFEMGDIIAARNQFPNYFVLLAVARKRGMDVENSWQGWHQRNNKNHVSWLNRIRALRRKAHIKSQLNELKERVSRQQILGDPFITELEKSAAIASLTMPAYDAVHRFRSLLRPTRHILRDIPY